MSKRIGIVSSYAEECGAAFYSLRLKKHLEKAVPVDILRLDVSMLRSRNPTVVKLADKHILEIAKKAKEYDGIILQFEPGLYGSKARHSYKRIMKILKGVKSAVVTVHGFDRPTSTNSLELLRLFVKRNFPRLIDIMIGVNSYRYSLRFWKKVNKLQKVKTHTFCKADAKILKLFYGMKDVASYPICYYSQDEVSDLKIMTNRDEVLASYGLDASKKYVGIFGFFGHYKGHLMALKMMEFLPDDYELLVVGGEHPHGIEPEMPIGDYLQKLLYFYENFEEDQVLKENTSFLFQGKTDYKPRKQIFPRSPYKFFLPKKKISHRVHFLGQVSDEQMPALYSIIDYVVLPYIKTRSGQSGSGPGTFALEFGCKTVFSNAPVFREMAKFFKDGLTFANVGNFVEFAQAIPRLDVSHPRITSNLSKAFKDYNPMGMVEMYLKLLWGDKAPFIIPTGLIPRKIKPVEVGKAIEEHQYT